jgi:hypothetical protein
LGLIDYNEKLVKKLLGIKPMEGVERILTDGEEIIDSIPCKKNLIEGGLILTPKRVFFYHSAGKGKYGTEEYPFDKISSINYVLGKFFGEVAVIEIHSSDDKLKVVSKNANDEVEAFVKSVKQYIEEYKTKSTQVPNNNSDVASQISKFAELRDKGILTEEEFTMQKRKLLGM